MALQARHDERSERLGGGSGRVAFEPFFRGHYRDVVRLVWVLCWFLIVVLAAVASFERREL